MGVNLSRWSRDEDSYSERNEETSDEDSFFFPESLLIEILSHVPSSDLLKNCVLVCHQWKDLIESHGLWKTKCLRDPRKIVPPLTHKFIPKHFYRMIDLYNPYGRNLLENPCGEDGLKKWTIHSNQGDGWKVEKPPDGADAVPDEVGSTSCFVTSYGECLKYQVVNLRAQGVTDDVMDDIRPQILIGEWHAARFDCGSTYNVRVALLDKDKEELHMTSFGPFREDQWTGRAWTKTEHTLNDYPKGVRFIGYEHSGQDSQFWAGHYGSKMTGAYVRLEFPKSSQDYDEQCDIIKDI